MDVYRDQEDLRLALGTLLAPLSADVHTRCADAAHVQLDYMQFCQAAVACPPGLAGHLSASAFLRLRRSGGGAVSAAAVHTYLSRRAAMLQLWQHLAAFDSIGCGTLSTVELGHAIIALAEGLPGLSGVEQHLPLPLYAAVAARKLLFFHGRHGRVKIQELVLSPVMAELLQLRPDMAAEIPDVSDNSLTVSSSTGAAKVTTAMLASAAASTALAAVPVSLSADEDTREDASWFAPATAARLVQLYSDLDVDDQGLAPADLIRFSGDGLTAHFVTRVFDEHASGGRDGSAGSGLRAHTHSSSSVQDDDTAASGQPQLVQALNPKPRQNPAEPRLALVDFLDFLLAWEHRGTRQGLRYFWPVLDVRRQGLLDRADVAAFFREVHALWLERGQYAELRIGDVVEEVFDLASPIDPQRIQLSDLQRCGAGGDIVGILADVAAFWEHDSKEALVAAQAELAG